MLYAMLGDGWKGPAENGLTKTQMLSRLAIDPKDAQALMSVYERYEREIRAAAISWLGNKDGFHDQAVNNILVAIGRQAGSYDPKSVNASEWVNQVVNAEARRLREALDGCRSKAKHTQRAP
jgi:DNA-directed RNA polymerase specialized sigma24 family protein